MDTVTVGKTENRGPAYRGLLAVVIILGVLIVVGLGALVVGFVMRLGGHAPSHNQPSAFVPPAGARVLSAEASGDRLVLRLRTPSQEEIDIVDTENGRLIAHFAFPLQRP
jgi:hypothetical protein